MPALAAGVETIWIFADHLWITAGLLILGGSLTLGTADKNMQAIMRTVFLSVAIMPVLLAVMVNFYPKSNAINLASRGEIPDAMLKLYEQEKGH